jgi:hypothetical protein
MLNLNRKRKKNRFTKLRHCYLALRSDQASPSLCWTMQCMYYVMHMAKCSTC